MTELSMVNISVSMTTFYIAYFSVTIEHLILQHYGTLCKKMGIFVITQHVLRLFFSSFYYNVYNFTIL